MRDPDDPVAAEIDRFVVVRTHGLGSQVEFLVEHIGSAAEAPLPQRIRDHRDRCAILPVVFGPNSIAQGKACAQPVEETARDHLCGQRLDACAITPFDLVDVHTGNGRQAGNLITGVLEEAGIDRIGVLRHLHHQRGHAVGVPETEMRLRQQVAEQ